MGTTVVVTVQAFAAGAIVAMLAESMIPEAHETGGRAVGLATALGFAVAAYLSLRAGG
jgi:zinc transporter, ZIP family